MLIISSSGPAAEKLKKKIQNLFKEKDLDIIVQCNFKITNYLELTLKLNDGPYRLTENPAKKPYSRQFRPPSINH